MAIFPPKNLWPRRDWMTVGIAALCGSKGPKAPNTIVMASDTLGSYGDLNSTTALQKLFVNQDLPLFAVAANDISKAASLLTKIGNSIAMHAPQLQYGLILRVISAAVTDYKKARFQLEVGSNFG